MLMVFLWRVQEKEAALNLTVDAFCRLVKQHANVAQLVTLYEHFSLLSNYLHLNIHIRYFFCYTKTLLLSAFCCDRN